ncbi:MAG: recombinase family protein [Clostridiales bacterium]|jgi:site-specific DNA recombinase|nr:recombinase family protein [Clostridiales bacterium]MDU6975215.1 recombinase family protein [Clostridiales bacterium]
MTAYTNKPEQITALDGDSNRIVNQKAVLSKYAADNGFTNPMFFIDDGVSGVTFERPNFNRMIAEIEAGNIGTVIVKDMSRLGRDYLKVGYYTEIFFVERDVRYIAINDGVDSSKGDNDFTPFRNLFNDFYAKDTSKKVRAIKRSQGMAREHLTKPPYGYKADPADRKKWIVDEEAAAVVKRIFDLCVAGKGPMQIAKTLKADKVLTTKAHYAKQKGKPLPENPYSWNENSVVAILERMDYCGHTVNFKSYSKSHKLKKRIPTTKEQQAVFRNTHEAIVEEAVFERVQELKANKRRPTKAERQGLFSGLVFCADCSSKLHFATCKSFDGSQDHYRCARYKSNTGDCTAHFIREETLTKIVKQRIFDVTAMFYEDITAFIELIRKQRFDKTEKEMKRKRREVGQAKKRIAELDRIFKRIYEDDINGTISHERFLKLSAEYEAEQKELTEKINKEQKEVDTYEQDKTDFDSFAAIIRKYVGITELTPTIVNEFVKKIVVHAPEKIDGRRFQKVDIVFNFVGEIHFPTEPQTERKETNKQEKTA